MRNPNVFAVGAKVMAPIGEVLHRGVVVEPPADQHLTDGFVCVQFRPPVAAAEPFTAIESVICPLSRLAPGWF